MANSKEAPRILNRLSNTINHAVREASQPGYLEVVGLSVFMIGMVSAVTSVNEAINVEVNKNYPVIPQKQIDDAKNEITLFERGIGSWVKEGQTNIDIAAIAPEDMSYPQKIRQAYETVDISKRRFEYERSLHGGNLPDDPSTDYEKPLYPIFGGLALFLIGVGRQIQLHFSKQGNRATGTA